MKFGKSLILSTFLILASMVSAQALNNNWRLVEIAYPAGLAFEYSPDGGEARASLQTYPLESLDEANGGSLLEQVGGDTALFLEEALYLIPVDAYEMNLQEDENMIALAGIGETERGERIFITTLMDDGKGGQMLVLVTFEEETFKAFAAGDIQFDFSAAATEPSPSLETANSDLNTNPIYQQQMLLNLQQANFMLFGF